MNEKNHNFEKLTCCCCEKEIIRFKLFNNMSHDEIVSTWNNEFHGRDTHSIQTVYKIRKEIKEGNYGKQRKMWPKRKSILFSDKLIEIKNIIEQDQFITNNTLGHLTDLQKSTVNRGLKILELKKFNTLETTKLSNSETQKSLTFCNKFIN